MTTLPSLTADEEEREKAVEARDEAYRDFIKETLGTGLFFQHSDHRLRL